MGSSVTPLSANFSLEGYRILSVLESDEWGILYQAESSDGRQVKIREFCPEAYSVRQDESGYIKFRAETPEELQQAKAHYDHLHAAFASSKFSGQGTEYSVYEEQPTDGIAIAARQRQANAQPNQAVKRPAIGNAGGTGVPRTPIVIKKKQSSGMKAVPLIILCFLGIIGFLIYQVSKTPPPLPKVVQVAPPKPKPKPKPAPVEVKETEPEPEPEPEPEVVVEESEPEPEPEPEAPTYDPTQKLTDLKKSICQDFTKNTGKISDAIVTKYAAYAEAFVREYVTIRKGEFSPAFEQWLKKNKLNKDVFATFYPPDPNVAANVDMLVSALGERAYSYPQLVLAFAIGRRQFGLGSFDLGHQGRYGDVMGLLQSMKDDGTWIDSCDLLIKKMPPINYYGSAPGKVLDSQYEVVHKYLASKKLTPKQAWIKKEKTLEDLKSEGITNSNLAELLHEELYRTNQLKRKRDPFPTCVEFFNFLVDKYEAIDSMKNVDGQKVPWDGIPLDCTPWPLMLPLSETRPLREAQSVWDRYLGKKSGPRLWRYGPYRMDKDPEPPVLFSMDPDPDWSPTSYDRHLHVGGVCGTMSLISRTSQVSMGGAAGPAGQPGHGNLVTYSFEGGIAGMTVGQSIATIKETTSCWYLNDAKTKRCGCGEYVLGLANSVNLSEKEQMDSRIAMNILKMIKEGGTVSEKAAENTLTYIVNNNPFYSEAWYMMFEDKGENLDAAIELVTLLRKNTDNASKLYSRKPYHKNMGRPDRNFKKTIEGNTQEYVSALGAALVEIALGKDLPPYKKSDWEKVMLWGQKESKDNPYSSIIELTQTATAMSRGSDMLVRSINSDFQKLASAYRKKDTSRQKEVKVSPETLVIQINSALMVMKEKDKLPLLAPMVEKIPPALKFRSKDNNVFLTDLYKCITEQYAKAAEKAGKTSEVSKLKEDIAKAQKEYEDTLPPAK